MATKNTVTITTKRNLEVPMTYLAMFLHRVWRATLKSNLRPGDKAEILRLLIFAFTIVVITTMFKLNQP